MSWFGSCGAGVGAAGPAGRFLRPLSAYGTALHGLAVAGLAGGGHFAVRLLALAERLGVLREFQPTMFAPRAREAALHTNAAAYTDVVSVYAAPEAGRVAGGGPRGHGGYFGSRLNFEVDQK